MLSATTTQSPLATQSSVFTIPSVSMGTGGINLTDHLFLPGMSALDPTHGTSDTKPDLNGNNVTLCVVPESFIFQNFSNSIVLQKFKFLFSFRLGIFKLIGLPYCMYIVSESILGVKMLNFFVKMLNFFTRQRF